MDALLCGKWKVSFDFKKDQNEKETNLYERSYVHFLLNHPDLVSAKCLATEWLFTDLVPSSLNAIEYMGGIGIQATILENLLKPDKHLVLDRDKVCCEQLRLNGFKSQVAEFSNADETTSTKVKYEVKLVDFPASSVLNMPQKWPKFYSLFSSSPELVVWTDTSVARPIQLHGKRYSKVMNCGPLNSHEDYVRNYSRYLYERFGYSIARAAFRARNAVYLAAKPGKHETEFNRFPVKECESGLKILN